MKPAIIISIPLVWGFRNVIKSGLYHILEDNYDVFLAVPEEAIGSMLAIQFQPEKVVPLYKPRSNRLLSLLNDTLKYAHRRRKATESDRIYSDWLKKEQNHKLFDRRKLASLASRAFENPTRFTFLVDLYRKHCLSGLPQSLRDQISRIKPVAALSTSYVMNWEWPLFTLFQNAGVPTATHILSFDNLTSRGYFPLRGFDQYYSWQSRMSEELHQFFGIHKEKISITGTPQFDFHILPQYHRDRHQNAKILGIDPEKPYIVYCANHYIHTPGEPELIRFLIHTLKATQRFKDYQWVIRIHPMDQYARWKSAFEGYPGVAISLPWSREDRLSYWAVPGDEELALLGNTLRYAAATVTMASTIALDSCVVDTPVICIGFHPNTGSAEDRYYREVHFSQHYRPISESGAVALVSDKDEFLATLGAAVDARPARMDERKRLVTNLCGPVDGKAAVRIAEAFCRLASRKENAPTQ